MKYSITRALSELKLLKSRLEKEIMTASFIAVKQGDKLRKPNSSIKENDMVDKIKKDYQSIEDLMRRISEIKTAIDNSNFTTKVKIGDIEMTVLEALVRKNNISFEKLLLSYMKNSLDSARRDYDMGVQENKNRVERVVSEQTSAGQKGDDLEKNAVEYIEKLYGIGYVDPLALNDKIKNLEESIEVFEKNVDYALSESNSTTFIEIRD